jgi:hypothetical protein
MANASCPNAHGFESYASLPIVLKNGEFYGTLWPIDPGERVLSTIETVSLLRRCADRIASIVYSLRPYFRRLLPDLLTKSLRVEPR